MFIGHNFGTEDNYCDSVKRDYEDPGSPTWRNLKLYFLPEADDLDEKECFFTNLYLGAIIHPPAKPGAKRKTTNRGKFKCSLDYHTKCVKALLTQVEIVRPSVIALLGANVPPPFGQAFPAYAPHSSESLADVQARQPAGGYRLRLLPDLMVQVIALVHPANPRSLESHREQGRLLGAAIRAAKMSITAGKQIALHRVHSWDQQLTHAQHRVVDRR